ncbi:MAG: PAS domain-containing protein, partial [Flavobacteriales bacterium]|nr:PAS domain-containing protein [Flavobacteriales bacterium]
MGIFKEESIMKEKAKQNLSYVEEVWREESDVTKAKNTEIGKYNIDKLLGFIFSPGPYYYYLFNFQTMEIDYVSDSITSVLGYEVSEMTVANWMSWLHPEDSDFIPVKEQMVVDFLFKQIPSEKIPKYKVSYDFRCKKKDGNYCRILHQAIAIDVDENGVMHKVLGVHTDITHLKKNSDQSVSFIGMD